MCYHLFQVAMLCEFMVSIYGFIPSATRVTLYLLTLECTISQVVNLVLSNTEDTSAKGKLPMHTTGMPLILALLNLALQAESGLRSQK